NGDTHSDLATADVGNVSVLLNNGDATFQSKVDYALDGGGTGLAVVVGDLNADGTLDLTVTSSTQRWTGYWYAYYANRHCSYIIDGQSQVLLGNGDGSFTNGASQDLGEGRSFSAAVGDLDNDGDLDLAVANLDANAVRVLLNNGNGTFGDYQEFPTGV